MIEQVSFTIDAGIINRLGLELVAKSETAVAELIKNAYDADANTVDVKFERAKQIGGTLIIDDDGVGMTREQLINGFMRLATTDKLHNPVSNIHKRPKAGKKGIGRFSTQRLGKKLIIVTQTIDSEFAVQLTINWDSYETDKEINEIKNDLEFVNRIKDKKSGTKLTIESLRDKWSEADIKRVYRYCAELIQPNFLKIGLQGSIVEESKKESFEALFFARDHEVDKWETVADPQTMIFDQAIAVFSGYIDENGFGNCTIRTREFSISKVKQRLNESLKISNSDSKNLPFESLKGSKIAFQMYYFIKRSSYYTINQMELKAITEYLNLNGGLKLYRNGFRVATLGDKGNDWANIDKNSRAGHPVAFGNSNVLGLVQVTDSEGKLFEEPAGREGLIEKEAFFEMQKFISTGIVQAFRQFASWFRTTDDYIAANPEAKPTATVASVAKIVDELKEATETIANPDATESEKLGAAIIIKQTARKLEIETKAAVNELEMLRVLAGVGLTIAEFIHEVKQFIPSLNGYINYLTSRNLGDEVSIRLDKMKQVLSSFLSYTSYFDISISQNVIRDLRPLDLRDVIGRFEGVVLPDVQRRNIELLTQFEGFDLITIPVHPSEWNTILQNLYSNAKKAILRANTHHGKILILCTKNKEKGMINLSFYDNGEGITESNKKRIFDAFFTTSTPVSNSTLVDENTGSGLGLYILERIIKNRNGTIQVGLPQGGYKTCITIQFPLATEKQLEQYGY